MSIISGLEINYSKHLKRGGVAGETCASSAGSMTLWSRIVAAVGLPRKR